MPDSTMSASVTAPPTDNPALSDTSLMPTYARLPVTFTHGKGSWLYDTEGKAYLDGLCGISVSNLGHSQPLVTEAIVEQAKTLLHTSNLYRIEAQEAAGAALCKASGMSRVFFANSGAEANESAIKIARLYGNREKKLSTPTILVMENAFHGRTMATLTATGNRNIQAGFEPLLEGFTRVAFNDLPAAEKAVTSDPSIVAILLEPIQGEGGINVAEQAYLKGLRQLCDQYGLLLMLDEIQTGNGRCGQYFAYHEFGIEPDVVTTAKGLGNGIPVGACLAKGIAAETFKPGNHGSTFGGNPLACRVAKTVVDYIVAEQLGLSSVQKGEAIRSALRFKLKNHPLVVDVRGQGLMIGIEIAEDCAEIVDIALSQGLLLNVTAGRVIRLLPPLTISDSDSALLIERVVSCINAFPNQR